MTAKVQIPQAIIALPRLGTRPTEPLK
ncbi:hypothetical protein LCGC14_2455560, partial [marine sediment metagenome]